MKYAAISHRLLTGCQAISTLPSMQHCQQVKYERIGTEITVEAKCTAPVGGERAVNPTQGVSNEKICTVDGCRMQCP